MSTDVVYKHTQCLHTFLADFDGVYVVGTQANDRFGAAIIPMTTFSWMWLTIKQCGDDLSDKVFILASVDIIYYKAIP